jgi:N-acetyl-anhydromuramyl-L-alanine amidase AmpD
MTTYSIDKTTYDKAAHYEVGHGYEPRTVQPASGITHSTSNPNVKNTAFTAEAAFLFSSGAVSAHFLVSKDGRIVQFLDPALWAAWHAGSAQRTYLNKYSIGIELHHSVSDPPYPVAQLDALAWLWSRLMRRFTIPREDIETHGQIALPGPYKRKTDPADWPHADFLAWRQQLPIPDALPSPLPYRVRGVPVYQRQSRTGPLAGWLSTGDLVAIDKTYADGGAHLANGAGFVDANALEEMP